MRWILVIGFLMSCVGAVVGAVETPGRDPAWADSEVGSILSKAERARFKALRSDEQREALVRSGRPDAGRESVEEIVRLFPESVKALNYCAGSLLELGDTARARALFEQSLGLDPDQPEVAAQLRVWRE